MYFIFVYLIFLFVFMIIGSAVAAADTISSPWTPASSGPPPDANGSGSDTKNLDVGEISDVNIFIIIYIIITSVDIFTYSHYQKSHSLSS